MKQKATKQDQNLPSYNVSLTCYDQVMEFVKARMVTDGRVINGINDFTERDRSSARLRELRELQFKRRNEAMDREKRAFVQGLVVAAILATILITYITL